MLVASSLKIGNGCAFLSEPEQTEPVLPVFEHPVVLETCMSQQSVLWAEAVSALWAAREEHFQGAQGADPPPVLSWSSVPHAGLPSTRDRDTLGSSQRKARKVRMELEHLSSQERLTELGAVQPGEVKAQGNCLNMERYWKGGCQVDRGRLLSVCPCQDHIKKHFSTLRVTEHWHSLPREPSSLEIFQIHLDMVLSFSWPHFRGEAGPDELWRSLPMSSSLWFWEWKFVFCQCFRFPKVFGKPCGCFNWPICWVISWRYSGHSIVWPIKVIW